MNPGKIREACLSEALRMTVLFFRSQLEGGDGWAFGLQCRKVVVIHAAAHLAADRGRPNGVNYFIRKTHGRHTKESPPRSATSGMGRSFSLRLDVQSRSDSQVCKSGA